MVKFSYNIISYARDRSLEQSISRQAEYGYDGVEFIGEPDEIDTDEANELLDAYGLEASSICSIYTEERDMTAAEEAARRDGIEYTKRVVEMAQEIGASVIVTRPSPVGRVSPDDPEKEYGWAIEGIQEVADFIADHGYDVSLGIEPWNRYETHLINTVGDALSVIEEIDGDHAGVWADLFHMAIEERSPERAIREAGDDLIHLHAADTNRAAPGRGHYDYRPIVEALKGIGYDGYISFELLPATANPFDVLEQDTPEADLFYNRYTRESIEFFRTVWERY